MEAAKLLMVVSSRGEAAKRHLLSCTRGMAAQVL
jgi:hypothetical protein